MTGNFFAKQSFVLNVIVVFLFQIKSKLSLMAFNVNFNITSKPGQVIIGIHSECVKSLIKRTSSATKRG